MIVEINTTTDAFNKLSEAAEIICKELVKDNGEMKADLAMSAVIVMKCQEFLMKLEACGHVVNLEDVLNGKVEVKQ